MPQSAIWQFSLQALHAAAWLVPLALVLAAALKLGRLRTVVTITAALTLVLVALGAYVRLTDAGLGCPDWPGCYGKLSPLHAEREIEAAQAQSPAGPPRTPASPLPRRRIRFPASAPGGILTRIVSDRTIRPLPPQTAHGSPGSFPVP